MDADVVVVGGGLAGLAAAVVAGRAGRRVVVLEGAGEVGGRARSQVRDGYVLNLGPHAVYLAGAGLRVLRRLGIDPPGGVPDAVRASVRFEGEISSLLGPLGLRERAAVAGFAATLPAVRTQRLAGITQEEWLDGRALPGRARLAADMLVRVATYAEAPSLLSADAAAGQAARALRGVRYLDGGWQSLVAALRAAAEDAGVQIRREARADAVADGGGRPLVALADGTTLHADAMIVAAGGPRSFTRLTGVALPEPFAVRAACLDVTLARLPRPAPTVVTGLDEPLYLSVHTTVAALAPPGGAVVHVARYLGADAADPAVHRAQLEALLDQAQPGWRDVLVGARFLPNLAVATALPLAERGGLAGRPDVTVGGLPGVTAAGDWVGPEGLLGDASLASAERAAELAMRAPALAA